MATPRIPPTPNPLSIALAHAIKELALIRRGQSRLEERADALEQYLRGILASSLSPAGVAAPLNLLPPAEQSCLKHSRLLLQLEARKGVGYLAFLPLPDGSANVRIDYGPDFVLPPTLAVLLEVLAKDPGRDCGELVGWKSREEVAAHLHKRTGKAFTVHSIQQLVSRLRKILARDGETNPYFVQANAKSGWRFALRRRTGV